MRQGVDQENDWENVDPSGDRVATVSYTEPEEEEEQGQRGGEL
jgi:hypothetical protein